jgi:hypothetical protein
LGQSVFFKHSFSLLAGEGALADFLGEVYTMAISSVSSNSPVQAAPKVAPPESTEATNGGKDVKKDGDADDAGATKPSIPSSVVNSLGQKIGGHLNVTA